MLNAVFEDQRERRTYMFASRRTRVAIPKQPVARVGHHCDRHDRVRTVRSGPWQLQSEKIAAAVNVIVEIDFIVFGAPLMGRIRFPYARYQAIKDRMS